MKKVIISFVVAVFLVATVGANAQNEKNSPLPFEKVGLGVKVSNSAYGGSFAYAIQENVHIGTTIGASYLSGYTNAQEIEVDGGVQFAFGPYFRYIFNNVGNMFPYIEANFSFTEVPTGTVIAGQSQASSSTINAEFGGLWFPFKTVSIKGGVRVLSFDIDISQIGFGIGAPFIGIDWWM